MTSCNNPNNVHLPLSWNSCTKRGIKIQNTPKLGIWGGLASQFSWPLEACWYLISQIQTDYSHRYPAMNFQLLSLFWDNLSIDCLKKRESSWIYSYQMCFVSRFHQQKQKYFLGGGSIKLRKCFTTLLAITRLLDFEVTTLPYPTRSWKTTTRWSLLIRGWESGQSVREDAGNVSP